MIALLISFSKQANFNRAMIRNGKTSRCGSMGNANYLAVGDNSSLSVDSQCFVKVDKTNKRLHDVLRLPLQIVATTDLPVHLGEMMDRPEECSNTLEGDLMNLVRRNEATMVSTIWRILKRREDTEDTYQEVLTTAWKKRVKIMQHVNPRALLLRICANAAYDLIRRRPRSHCSMAEIDFVESTLGPADDAAAREMGAKLWAEVGNLPRCQAIAVCMRILNDCRFVEIAAALQCAEATARQHYFKGRQRLGEQLRTRCPELLFEETEK